MRVVVEQIDPSKCPYRVHGENIAYLSRGKLRMLAKNLGVSPDGTKLELFKHIVAHLQQRGAKAEIDDTAQTAVKKEAGYKAATNRTCLQ